MGGRSGRLNWEAMGGRVRPNWEAMRGRIERPKWEVKVRG